MPHDANKEEMGGGEEDGAAAEQKGGEAGPDGGSESVGAAAGKEPALPLQVQTYKESAKKYYLQHTDNNMVGGVHLRCV